MKEISIGEFASDNDMEAFRKAAKFLRENPNTILNLENRTYVLRDKKAVGLQIRVMRGLLGRNPESELFNPKANYQIGIDLNGAKNIIINGNGAKLIFDGFMENISCQFCENVEIKNLSIDLKRKAYSKGKITKSGRCFGLVSYLDLDFGDLPLLSEKMPSTRLVLCDGSKKCFTGMTTSIKVKNIGLGKYRFYGSMSKGNCTEAYVINTFHFRPSILIYEAIDTKITNVTIHSHCGMGIVGHRSKNILVSGLKVMPADGDCMSTNTDATHFTSCTGLLRFENCYFEGHGDDAVNVHTYYHSIVKKEGSKYTLEVKAPTGTHCQKLDYFNEGDEIELCNFSDLTPIDIFKVKKVIPCFNEFKQIVEFDRELPPMRSGLLLADITQLPRFEFVNCKVVNHIARALLVKTRNVLIENNSFDANSFAGIHVAAEAFWHEGIVSKNVTIKNNDIRNYDAGITIEIAARNPKKPVHENILIESNYIDAGNHDYGIIAKCVDGLQIKNNKIKSLKEAVFTKNCTNVNIES